MARILGRCGVSEIQGAIALIALSLALSSLTYSYLQGYSKQMRPFFTAHFAQTIDAKPLRHLYLEINTSRATQISALTIDGKAVGGKNFLITTATAIESAQQPWSYSGVAIFSVFSTRQGTLAISSDGVPYVNGEKWNSTFVKNGWQVIWLENATRFTITLPDAQVVSSTNYVFSALITPLPIAGSEFSMIGNSFRLLLPVTNGSHSIMVIFRDGSMQTQI